MMHFDPEFIKALKANMQMSPHTVLLLNNPIHAYLCEGDACRERVNAIGATESEPKS